VVRRRPLDDAPQREFGDGTPASRAQFAPVVRLLSARLRAVRRGGRSSDLDADSYHGSARLGWQERPANGVVAITTRTTRPRMRLLVAEPSQ